MKKILSGTANKTLYKQILFTALAFVVMVVLSYIFMSLLVRRSQIRNADSVFNFAQNRIKIDLADARSILNKFSETARIMILNGASAEELEAYINEFTYYTQQLGVYVLDPISYYGYFETLPNGPVLIKSRDGIVLGTDNPEKSDWYQAAIQANGSIIATVPYISKTEGKVFTYAKAIFDDDKRIGVIAVNVSLELISQEVVSTALSQGGYGVLANQNLLIIAHPNSVFEGLYLDDPTVPLSVDIARLLKNGNEVVEQSVKSYTGKEAVAFFRKLPNDWYLGIVSPIDQFYQGSRTMGAVLTILGAILGTVLIYILVKLDKARAKSDEESRQKSMFLANMSHEIRTPINAIIGMTSIGRVAGAMERKDYCFSKIEDASRHLLGVINDILDISKIEANKIELSPTEFNFEKMLQQIVNVINFRVDEKHQKLTIHIDREIPKILYADDQRFSQVITNLLSNAVKFSPEEGIINLSAKLITMEKDDYIIQVAVKDDGIGISSEQQTKLFQSFQQADTSTNRKYGGTGLGLAISKSIVEMMGGKIWVESVLGQGATFVFTVKVKKGDESNFNLGYQGINWQNIRILTVDDDPNILVYFKEIVSTFGAHCDVAANAEEALQFIEESGIYNIYFIDLRMPDIDGISLTKQIRAREKSPENSIVIMISSADLSSIENEAKKAGVDRFILKPLFPSSISDVISDCIGVVNKKTEEAPVDINGTFKGYNILFAEDIDINREIVIALLEPTLVNIDCAVNGVEAVQMFCKYPEKYDLIFMDVQMPEMDGYEATRQIRSLNNVPHAKHVPIIAMTANVFKEDIENCRAAGMNDHLGKPLNLDSMVATMRKYFK